MLSQCFPICMFLHVLLFVTATVACSNCSNCCWSSQQSAFAAVHGALASWHNAAVACVAPACGHINVASSTLVAIAFKAAMRICCCWCFSCCQSCYCFFLLPHCMALLPAAVQQGAAAAAAVAHCPTAAWRLLQLLRSVLLTLIDRARGLLAGATAFLQASKQRRRNRSYTTACAWCA
jgi:hypothetical protein